MSIILTVPASGYLSRALAFRHYTRGSDFVSLSLRTEDGGQDWKRLDTALKFYHDLFFCDDLLILDICNNALNMEFGVDSVYSLSGGHEKEEFDIPPPSFQ